MARNDIILENAAIITGNGPVYPDGALHLREGRIHAIGRRVRAPRGARKIDAGGRYVLPGFINPHMHLYGLLARGMAVPRMPAFGDVLRQLWWRLDRALDHEEIFLSALLGGAAALRAGVTTLFDHHASYGTITGSLGVLSEALAKLGIRTSLCFEISDRLGADAREEAVAESGLWLESVRNWLEEDPGFLQRGMVGLHASLSLTDEALAQARELMEIYGVGAHVHVAEGIEDVEATRKGFGMTPVERLTRAGVLDERSLAIHCVHVTREDIKALARSKATVVHNPLSNANNAVGTAPVLEMAAEGIPVVVGTDGMSAGVACDLRAASVVHKAGAADAQAGWEEVRDALWVHAPAVASRAFGLPIGVLAKGAAADVIVVEAWPTTPLTRENAWGHMLFGCLAAPVRTTIVAGELCLHDFRLAALDEALLAAEARKLAKKLWKRI